MAPITPLGALELARKLKSDTPPVLLDVREPWEFETAHIQGALLIPLSELGKRFSELSPEADTCLYCHHGVRSQHAAMFLAEQGFTKLANLNGGIDAWSAQVDPSVPRY